jgi:four helix bundle protein
MAYDFRKLAIWNEGMSLLVKVYALSATFPSQERYSLTDQLRRAANSVIANIAEAQGRYYIKDKIRVLYQSRGEIEEVKSHLLVAEKLAYGNTLNIHELIDGYATLGRRLNAFIRSINAD